MPVHQAQLTLQPSCGGNKGSPTASTPLAADRLAVLATAELTWAVAPLLRQAICQLHHAGKATFPAAT